MYYTAKFTKGQIEYLTKEGIFCKDELSARIFIHGDTDALKIYNNLREKYTYEEIHFFPSDDNITKKLPLKKGGKKP